jgi:hypothetical protein
VVLLALTFAVVATDPALAATRKRRPVRAKPAPAAPAPASRAMVLPFIHDDYSRALAEARQRQVPIFIESWAPW